MSANLHLSMSSRLFGNVFKYKGSSVLKFTQDLAARRSVSNVIFKQLDCPAALERIKEDRPITIKDDKGNTSKCIADIVSLFITLMDKLRLEIKAMDELHPDLRDLSDTMNRLSIIPSDFEGKQKVNEWLGTLSAMQASEELSVSQVRQLIFDLETSYNAFNKLLHNTT